jgi:hypothetical protein
VSSEQVTGNKQVISKKVCSASFFGFHASFLQSVYTPQLAAVKLWQRLEFMVVNPTRTKNFFYKKNPRRFAAGIFYFILSRENMIMTA